MSIRRLSIKGLLNWLKEFEVNGYQQSLDKAKEKAGNIGLEETSGFDYRNTRGRKPSRFKDNNE